MNPEEIGRILDEIGERVGPAGEYAWQLAIIHKSIVAWMQVAVPPLVLVLGLAMGVLAGRRVPNWNDPSVMAVVCILGYALAFVGLFTFFAVTLSAIPDALIPEWAVIRDLIGTVR